MELQNDAHVRHSKKEKLGRELQHGKSNPHQQCKSLCSQPTELLRYEAFIKYISES